MLFFVFCTVVYEDAIPIWLQEKGECRVSIFHDQICAELEAL